MVGCEEWGCVDVCGGVWSEGVGVCGGEGWWGCVRCEGVRDEGVRGSDMQSGILIPYSGKFSVRFKFSLFCV